ncbi:MAG: hypothetical protein AAF830_13245 [Pseudomonadota bacterium]
MATLTITGFQVRSFAPEAPVNVLCDGKSVGTFGPTSEMPITLPEGIEKVVLRQLFRPSQAFKVPSEDAAITATLYPLVSEGAPPIPYISAISAAFIAAIAILMAPLEGMAIHFAALVTILPLVMWFVCWAHPALPVAFKADAT